MARDLRSARRSPPRKSVPRTVHVRRIEAPSMPILPPIEAPDTGPGDRPSQCAKFVARFPASLLSQDPVVVPQIDALQVHLQLLRIRRVLQRGLLRDQALVDEID